MLWRLFSGAVLGATLYGLLLGFEQFADWQASDGGVFEARRQRQDAMLMCLATLLMFATWWCGRRSKPPLLRARRRGAGSS